jgi:hypothetical protein
MDPTRHLLTYPLGRRGKFKKVEMGWTFLIFAKIFPVIPFVVWGGFFGQQCRVLFESFRIDVTSFDPF